MTSRSDGKTMDHELEASLLERAYSFQLPLHEVVEGMQLDRGCRDCKVSQERKGKACKAERSLRSFAGTSHRISSLT